MSRIGQWHRRICPSHYIDIVLSYLTLAAGQSRFVHISPDDDPLLFQGIDGVECEEFIFAIRRKAIDAGKSKDNEWLLEFASSCFIGDALRWHIELDDEIAGDWRRLQRAMMLEWPAPKSRAAPGYVVLCLPN